MAEDGAAGQSWFGLCLTMLVQGRPSEALQACRAALGRALSTPQRSTLEKMEPLLAAVQRKVASSWKGWPGPSYGAGGRRRLDGLKC